ncbi:MAG TPA: hypothetical protein VMH04_15715 [Candidatus Solibacter sp.]|nr:hypothetical protein [Candidatus Solibacter sp.]
MRRIVFGLALGSLCSISMCGQQSQSAQTARQALLEMFFSKTPGTFAMHLPAATRAALEKSGALASLQQYSVMASQMQTPGQNLQTFETGSVLLSAENPKTGDKVEITVENDALRSDHDDIEMAFHVYKNGKEESTPFMPQMTFTMKQESHVWTLNEIAVTVHLPLADPTLLKAITEKMTPQVTGVRMTSSSTALSSHPETPSQSAGSDAMVLAAMRTILTAENTYASRYPNVGFTCSLSSLDGFGSGEPNERQAMLINSGLASGKRYGFVFTLSECSGTPATAFRLTAAPSGNVWGRKAFCSDQTGKIKSSEDGNAASCVASGALVQ